MIHALLKQSLHSEDLLKVAEEGERLTKQLCSKVTSHRRALEKQAQTNEKAGK